MKHLYSIISIVLITYSCNSKTPNPFLVTNTSVGLITDSTQVKDLPRIFANDSIVNFKDEKGFISHINTIDIYEKGGQPLLSITPVNALDSTATISSIRVIDSKYVTAQQISSASTYKDIKATYSISKISNLINSVVVNVKELNASFTIDKKDLPANMRFDMDMSIDPIQIPDDAKVKFFMMHF